MSSKAPPRDCDVLDVDAGEGAVLLSVSGGKLGLHFAPAGRDAARRWWAGRHSVEGC